MSLTDINRWKAVCIPHGVAYSFLLASILCLVVLTSVYATRWRNLKDSSIAPLAAYAVENGIIGFPPRLPDDGQYVQWTFLQMNDVYELLPLDQGRKGGLARVAYLRQLLLRENADTITVLAGDLISPSALGTAVVNGSALNGKQMIATMNTLGLNYMALGNHEFDVSQSELLARMNESKFTWIASNVFRANSSEPIGSSVTHKLLTINGVRILLIGLLLEHTSTYARFTSQASLINNTRQFIAGFANGTYDVLVALTHLDIAEDIELASKIPQIDMILGGHEHEDYSYLRGPDYTPIYKADANAYTVFIHRCAFNLRTRKLRVYSTLATVSSNVPEEAATAAVANYWYHLGIQGFAALGYPVEKAIACLPAGLELDGRAETVRSSQTLMSDAICESMLFVSNGSAICVFNSGAIRIDDVLRDTITGYDVVRVLPFVNPIVVLSVPGGILAQVLKLGMSLKGNGMFLSYTGIQTPDGGATWLFNGVNVETSALNYTVVTIEYARSATGFNNGNVTIVRLNVTQTTALMNYLPIKYPPC